MNHLNKVKTAIIAAICMISIHSSAQEQPTINKGKLTPKIGVKGGLNFTNLYVENENMKLGGRYSYGLKEVGKDGSLSGNINCNSKNSAFSLFLAIGF